MTRHGIPVWCKGQGENNVARGAPEGEMLERRQQMCEEDSKGIRNQGSKQKLHLRKETTTGNGIRG
jgi:hypothetical protein